MQPTAGPVLAVAAEGVTPDTDGRTLWHTVVGFCVGDTGTPGYIGVLDCIRDRRTL